MPIGGYHLMKRLLSCVLGASLAVAVSAQDLETVSFVDQLDSGSRGNNSSANNSFSNPDGSEFEDYTGPDLSGTASYIRYINTWVNGEVESPVRDITTTQFNPDRPSTNMDRLPIMPNNRRPVGSASANTAMIVGDDGGYNAIFFGESDDADYFAEVDMYCAVFTPSTPTVYEVSGLAVRAGRDSDPQRIDSTFNVDRAGSYALVYDVHRAIISARKWTNGNTVANIFNRVASTYTEYGTLSVPTSAWYTLKIVADGDQITFFVNGTQIATTTDTTYANGRPGLYYREGGTGAGQASELELQGIFDHLRAGPSSQANVSDWSMY